MTDPTLKYREQHKQRLSYMPWLYWTLKPKQREWAQAWQQQWQDYLQQMETIEVIGDCFISPDAQLFAERGRPIIIEQGSFIGAHAVLHGPITIGKNVGINHHVTMDGGSKGIAIGNNCRIAAYCHFYAFNHGIAADRNVYEQPVTSKGIVLQDDVWLGAHVGVVDGVTIHNGAVVGMQSVVTKNVAAGVVVGGNPARFIRDRG
ncbi:acyltransferase [Saccharophagus degradans]|uniref:Acyltransferase n=1 Tax=Saccharophagus degradans TaxID=86304 RepID=A0AAW7XDT5_9GAMM|nr:acyltransferase [Saccharophagus degradans]MDO6424587.1 acyltransferase [Saccharophagus degradans]MDO6608790.1 acyltransferase [Saccharophagus degradans]